MELDALQDGPEVLQHAVHTGGVERVADAETAGATSGLREVRRDPLDLGLVAGHHDGGRAVHGGDTHTISQEGKDFVLRRLHRRHRTTGGQRLHQRTTRGDHPARIRKGPHSGYVRGSQLTDGMSQQVVRLYTPGLQQAERGRLEGEQSGLRPPRLVQALTPEHHLPQLRTELPTHLVQRRSEHRERPIQLTPHPRPLRTLPREQHR
ncbi:hypothetical protein QR77_29170, partial [Streptomyces sp. 150FB]